MHPTDPNQPIPTTTSTLYSHYPNGCAVKEDLLNRDVYNEFDEKIGDLRDVILGADGRAQYYVIGVGGFLGLGEHNVRIACDHLHHNADHLILKGYTKDQLKDLPDSHHLRQI
ncbi:hypothetical protein PAEH1_00980 [Paenalcaligenes hominis]|uniref:PRC-barrel domain-containing protein n=1 Tax=Paenalcaligenes hominis TaxID=643674 RepID=A0A1U9JXG8_9BURK|nr:PRC-barrel domain-containing protein [Paenalcaligenes hominis]AQS50468.1 hypothetical protein PAEH1_00980 [Paenalcaligenes hominis]